MSTRFPVTGIDDATTLPNPSAVAPRNNPSHAGLHGNTNDAIKAVETKLGTGATTPIANVVLFGTGTGVSAWKQLSSAELLALLSDKTGTGAAVFANTPTLVTPKVDTINESTLSNGVTVAGLNIKSGLIAASGIPTASITNAMLSTTAGQPGGAWQSWTPVWTNLTTGNGTTVARYIQTGKRVEGYLLFVFGTTSAITGVPTLPPPVPAATTIIPSSDYISIGTSRSVDNGVGSYDGILQLGTTGTFLPCVSVASGTYVNSAGISATAPFTWGTGDRLHMTFSYEAA